MEQQHTHLRAERGGASRVQAHAGIWAKGRELHASEHRVEEVCCALLRFRHPHLTNFLGLVELKILESRILGVALAAAVPEICTFQG
jgi:hypothetical protein